MTSNSYKPSTNALVTIQKQIVTSYIVHTHTGVLGAMTPIHIWCATVLTKPRVIQITSLGHPLESPTTHATFRSQTPAHQTRANQP